jgi:hypothetical protein
MSKGTKTLPYAIRIGRLGPDRRVFIPSIEGAIKVPADMIGAQGDGVFEIGLTDSACVAGWYELEFDGQADFRWTGPEQVATIALTLAPRDYDVHIAYDRPVALTDEDFSVSANGQVLAIEIEAISAVSREARFTIPAAMIANGAVRLAIDVGAVMRPSEHGGKDKRALGVVVHGVHLATKSAWPDTVHIRSTDLEFGGQKPETWGFKKSALLLVPNLLDLPARTNGAFTDIAIDVAALIFSDRPNCVWELEVRLREKVIATRQFRNFTQRHQIIVPTSLLHEASNNLQLSARAISGPRIAPRFFVRVFYLQADRLIDAVEQSSVWVFSTARSGSSWLSQDILCHSHDTRSMDEPGIGRLFAPVDWVAERFYDLAHKDAYAQSGLEYETRVKPRADTGFIAPFERSFMFGGQETNVWSPQNRRMYLDLIRTTMFQHVLHEWGVLDYRHIVFKMPNDSHAADVIMQALPDAFMILLMRDGRDVMKSRFSPFASQDLATTTDPALRLHAISFYAHLWNFQVDIMQSAFAAHAPGRRLLLHYEELRVAPTAQLRVMFDKIGMEMSDAALDALVSATKLENMPAAQKGPDKPRQTGQIGKYANVFSHAEIALMDAIMGYNLRRFGYVEGDAPGLRASLEKDARFDLPLGDDGFSSGWYRLERTEDGPARWTGPGPVATIALDLPRRDWQITISYNRPLGPGTESLVVTVNGRELAVVVTRIDADTLEAAFTIPADLVAKAAALTQIAIDVGQVVRPSDHGGADGRLLGIVVFGIVIVAPELAVPVPPPQAAEPPSLPLSIIGDGEQLGAGAGLSPDRWVGPELRLTIQPHRPVRRVTVHGWFHNQTPTDGEVCLRIGNQSAVVGMAPGMFAVSINLPAETSAPISLTMAATNWLLGEGPDGRKLVFVLQRIVLEEYQSAK